MGRFDRSAIWLFGLHSGDTDASATILNVLIGEK